MTGCYTLIGQTAAYEPDTLKWARWFEEEDRIVKQESVGNVWVSTIFLGIDHSFDFSGREAPVLFETMAFWGGNARGGELMTYRCSTWAEAEAQHEAAMREAGELGFQLRAMVEAARDWWSEFKHYWYWIVWPNHKGSFGLPCMQCWKIRREFPDFFRPAPGERR
jgi:hypothetical protein